jgi:anti-sigma factor RsiW
VSNLLRQLESDEAILLMYLADELPPEDRQEVSQMLATDPRMRALLERVREAHDGFAAAMPALDRATRLPAPEAAGVRRVVRAMRQWQARRIARPAPAPPGPGLMYPWWAYPLAAAASVVIAFLVWWGHADRSDRLPEMATGRPGLYGVPAGVSPDIDIALAWQMSSPAEESDEVAALVDPSDYAVLLMIDDADAGPAAPRAAPKHNSTDPADTGLDEDEYL